MRDYVSMRERSDERGYMRMCCPLCGWEGWTDTGVCEGCVFCTECGKPYTDDEPCACCRECGYSMEENRCICNNEQEQT